MKVGIEMGEYKTIESDELFDSMPPVIVSTVQTQTVGGDGKGRMSKFDPFDFGLLVCDECHRFVAPSCRRIIDYYKTNPNLKILGVTATPDRADEQALGQIFDHVAFDYPIYDVEGGPSGIGDGWLVPIEQQFVSISGLSYEKIRTTAGDLNQSDLDAVMRAEKNLQGVASATLEISGNWKGLGFASSVNHAKMLADIFNRHKPGMAAYVHAQTDKLERKKIIADFRRGKIQWVWNCGIFLEGFDDPNIEIVCIARPTKSRSLYEQMIGRGTRPHDSIAHKLNECPNGAQRKFLIAQSSKPNLLVIDFAGNSGRHKLVTTADILGGKLSDDVIESARQKCLRETRKSGNPVRMDELLEEQEVKLEEKRKREIEQAAQKANLIAKAKFKVQKVDPFDLLQIKPALSTRWDKGKQLSIKQRKFLRDRDYDPDQFDYEKGSQLIGALIERNQKNLCTLPTVKLLKRYDINGINYTRQQASKLIEAIKDNGWKRPWNLVLPEMELSVAKEVNDSADPF